MLYAMPARSSHQRVAGLAVVAAFHVLLVILIANSLRIVDSPPLPPPDIQYIPDKEIAPPPTREKPFEMPRVGETITLDPPPVVVEQTRPTITPPAHTNEQFLPESGPHSGVAMDNPAKNVSANVGIACPNSQAVRNELVYPMAARREGVQGEVLARFVVGAGGQIRDITIIQSASRLFNPSVISALRRFECVGQGTDVTVEVPFVFRLN